MCVLCVNMLAFFTGGYFLRSSTTNQGKLSRRLLSPVFTVDNVSCLTFHYYLQALVTQHMAAFAVYAVPTDFNAIVDNSGRDLLWVVRQVTNDIFHQGQAEITTGSFRLLFEVNGQGVKAALDDVLLIKGHCPNTSMYCAVFIS